MRYSTTFVTLLASVTYVAAHGYVSSITADGQTDSGWLPFTDPYMNPVPERVVRKIPDDGPVVDVSSTDIACNKGGNVGTSLTFDVNAGSDMIFQWNTWPTSHKGPVTTFMASCNGDCSSFTASDGKWFKIDQAGYTNGQWAAEKLIADGNKWTSTIPAGLASGQYLVRHEIVALHNTGEAQYYPSCVQVTVKNGGADKPSASELTSFPGMYDGYKWPNIYVDNLDGFVVAGPGVVSFADGNPSDPAPSSPSDPAPSSTPDPAPSSASDPAAPYPSDPAPSSPSDPAPSSPSDPAPVALSDPAPSSPSNPAPPLPTPTPPSNYPHYGGPSSNDSRPDSKSTPAKPNNTDACKSRKGAPKKRSFSARHFRQRSSNH